jgi:hypothetical protein
MVKIICSLSWSTSVRLQCVMKMHICQIQQDLAVLVITFHDTVVKLTSLTDRPTGKINENEH